MATQATVAKKKPSDFIFGKVIGEGSYSTVFLAKEVSSGKEYAIKVLEKTFIVREKKTKYVHREKDVIKMLNHPFFVKLYFTFQDESRLYFGLTYAKKGELLEFINKLGCFDEKCTRFYVAEIILALEHMHSLGVIHRDLKPENILLSEDMHIKITDFGTAKILGKTDEREKSTERRKNSFVGTAQYVSPDILNPKDPNKEISCSCDLWALGCINYQLLSGQLPFWGSHDYQIFQKITKLEYEFPQGFNELAKDLVEKLLVIDPDERLGSDKMGGYGPLKSHPFFNGIEWDTLPTQTPPELLPFLPKMGDDSEDLWSQYKAGLDDNHLSRLIGINLGDKNSVAAVNDATISPTEKPTKEREAEPSKAELLEKQRRENEYHQFVEGNLILKQGLVDKRKGLFARRRMLLLTEGPHLYYVDPQAMVLKGEIPWSEELRTEAKNFKIYFVHTPNRTYYLEDPTGNALKWCKKIEEVWHRYYES